MMKKEKLEEKMKAMKEFCRIILLISLLITMMLIFHILMM